MPVLSDVDIKEIISDDRGILIFNGNGVNIAELEKDANLTGLGYDLRIGFICDADTGDYPSIDEENESRYVLLPWSRYLVVSEEYIYLSGQYMATLHSRASYALKGLIIASTTVDPNYSGCIYTSLINATSKPVFIKQHNAFATMVIHELYTSTEKNVPKNEAGKPMTARATLNGPYCNVNKEAGNLAIIYGANIQQQVQDEYDKAKVRMSIRCQQQKDAQAMEQKEATLQEKINEIEQELKDMRGEYKKERRKRYLISGVLGICVALFIVVVCYVFLGWPFIHSMFTGIIGLIGFWGSIVTLWEYLKKRESKVHMDLHDDNQK